MSLPNAQAIVPVETKEAKREEVFNVLKEIVYEVAPSKIVDEITYESSLIEDFAFDSINVMDMFLKIQERYELSDSSFNDFLVSGQDGFDVSLLTLDVMCNNIVERI